MGRGRATLSADHALTRTQGRRLGGLPSRRQRPVDDGTVQRFVDDHAALAQPSFVAFDELADAVARAARLRGALGRPQLSEIVDAIDQRMRLAGDTDNGLALQIAWLRALQDGGPRCRPTYERAVRALADRVVHGRSSPYVEGELSARFSAIDRAFDMAAARAPGLARSSPSTKSAHYVSGDHVWRTACGKRIASGWDRGGLGSWYEQPRVCRRCEQAAADGAPRWFEAVYGHTAGLTWQTVNRVTDAMLAQPRPGLDDFQRAARDAADDVICELWVAHTRAGQEMPPVLAGPLGRSPYNGERGPFDETRLLRGLRALLGGDDLRRPSAAALHDLTRHTEPAHVDHGRRLRERFVAAYTAD